MVDCSSWNNGCGGGNIDWAFDYISENGLDLETTYPYEAKDGTCRIKADEASKYKIDSHVDVTPYSDEEMQKALQLGPVSIAIEADTYTF